MARARNIKPGFFKNEELGECDPLARILFIGLWSLADRNGLLEERQKRIKVEILPWDDCNIDKLLQQLSKHKLIYRYPVDDTNYIWIPKFTKHQNPHMNEPASEIPVPPGIEIPFTEGKKPSKEKNDT